MKELRPMMGGWYHDGVGWGGWIMMTLAMVAFWGLIVFVLVALLRGTGGGRPDGPVRRQPSPMEILDERFARGEIDEDEYHARQAALRAAERGPVA